MALIQRYRHAEKRKEKQRLKTLIFILDLQHALDNSRKVARSCLKSKLYRLTLMGKLVRNFQNHHKC